MVFLHNPVKLPAITLVTLVMMI